MDDEEERLRAVALRNAESILAARRRADSELLALKEKLEQTTVDLRRQRASFEVTLSSIGDAVITVDVRSAVTFLNPVAEEITGWNSDEALGQPLDAIFRILNEQTRQPVENPVEKVLRQNRTVGLANHTVLVSRSGKETAIEDSAAPIRDEAGSVTGVVMVFHDVTARRTAERALREETRILELLNETGTAIAAEMDLQKLVQTVTDAATNLSGARFGAFFYNVVDQAGESFLLYALSGAPREAFEKFGLPRNTPVFNPTFSGQGVVRSGDITKDPRYGTMSPHHGMPKGHLPVCSYLAVPVVSRSGEVIGGLFFGHPDADVFTERAERLMVGIAAQAAIGIDNARLYEAAQHEIERREQAEATLREVDRRKDEFLATLAHELRNPLAPIRQAAMISKAPSSTDAQKRWSHDVIARQVHHMSLLLDDLLDVSRITRGTLQLRKQATELASVIDAAVETARPALDVKRHKLTIDIPDTPIHLSADPLRLAQVLSNLLTNAAKYTDPGGEIRIAGRAANGAVEIDVTDTGIGIAREVLPDIFQMFSQVKATHDRSDGGLGIGLALARGLVELHGGAIEARSEGHGHGSTFRVRLPLGSVDVPTYVGGTAGAREDLPRKRRILLADDNHDSAHSLATLLRLEGHEVTVVHDGRKALAAFSEVAPDFALLDIGMPGLNGYQVAEGIRAAAPGAPVVLVAVTGWGKDSDKARARAAGFDHHFTKPVEPDRLLELIRKPGDESR
jgi:PAS domain S-box-containing protein